MHQGFTTALRLKEHFHFHSIGDGFCHRTPLPQLVCSMHLRRAACQDDQSRLESMKGLVQILEAPPQLKKSGPPRKLLDPLTLSDHELAKMNMDWSPCTDPKYEQPDCGERNLKPCTRKGCTGIFEKTGEACLFCHAHPADVIARFEAFRGFARRCRSTRDARRGRH